MTNTTNGSRAAGAGRSGWRADPLPDAPQAAGDWPDDAARLRDQQEALGVLIREDLSGGRALAFLACAAVVTFVTGLVPVMVVNATKAEGSEGTDVAVSLVLGLLVLAVLAVPALLVLRALRRRSVRRFGLMRQWAAVDRGPGSEFPTRYGVHGYPHGRFFYAAVVLVLAVILSVAALAGVSDPGVLALLPCLVVAGVFAWTVARKYAGRHGWSARERLERIRAQRRERYRERLGQATAVTAGTDGQRPRPAGVHPAGLYAALLAPAVVVTLVFVIGRPEEVLGLSVAAVLALAVLVLGLPRVVAVRRRERSELDAAARLLAPSFPAGTAVHPVRYGLAETAPGNTDREGPSDWDGGPTRTGALAIDGGALRLRGTDGAMLDLPLGDVTGVVLVPSGVTWVPDSADLLLRSGTGIECRSPQVEALLNAFADAGVPVLRP